MSAVRLVQSVSPAVYRRHAGSTITLGLSVYVDDVLTDASAITFQWRMGLYGDQTSVTPTHAGTGLYSAAVTPEEGGDLYFRWDTGGALDVAQEGALSIVGSRFSSI